MPNLSTKWKVPTPIAGETFDPPTDYKTLAQNIEDRAAGAAQLVADATARDAIPTAQKYPGKRVRLLSDSSEYDWDGSGWKRAGDTGWVTTGVFSPAANYAVNSQYFRRVGSLVEATITVTYSGATIVVPTDGNLANQTIGTVINAWSPGTVNAPLVGVATGPVMAAYISTAGNVGISAVSPGYSYASGISFTIGGMFFLT